MARKIPQESIALITHLCDQGLKIHEIVTKTGISRITVARHVARHRRGELTITEQNALSQKKLADDMAKDRLTMSRGEVAEKYGVNQSWVHKLTADHQLASQFKSLRFREHRKDNPAKEVKKPKLKPKPTKKKKDVSVIDQTGMQKGLVKLKKNETVLPNRIHKPKKSIPMYDSKNTVLFVDIDEPKCPDQIRAEWHEAQNKSFKKFAS
ncbi:hypothetical protein [Sphingobacterium hotanense]|uniref:Uncharacterized protein n=1 Tax=Sphingobacterium hotanense TaxID=649196 RepID=A0ABT7NQM1_9SPHI|nr:hypothetical protein [Sphingobacterium hotanense]MDM1049491.1 hypothetical protein [Sphingobacterium hotanense]